MSLLTSDSRSRSTPRSRLLGDPAFGFDVNTEV
jgi:hypothetical protein